jgi:hypothetical protein
VSVQRRGWKYIATRLNGDGTETLLDPDVGIEEVQIEEVLSGDNSITGTISPGLKKYLDSYGRSLFKPWSTALYAESDGSIRCGGIMTGGSFDGSEGSLEFTGFTGYLRDLPYTGSGYAGIQVDPADVVDVIWNHAQGQPGGNLGVHIPDWKTGIKIGTTLEQVEFDTQSGPVSFESGPVKLNWYSTFDLAGMIDDLASENSFDYRERHYWKPDGSIGHEIEFKHPSIGRKRTDLRFTFGVNVFEVPSVAWDGGEYATGVMVLGAGEGASGIKSLHEPGRSKGDPLRRVAIVQDDTIKSKKNADSRAKSELQWRKSLDDISDIVVHDHPDAPLGAAQVGDTINLTGRTDWGSISITARILSIAYEPDSGKVAQYRIARTDKILS